MTCTSRTTLRRRRLVAAALALPLSLAMTGTAFATGTGGASADARTAAATAPDDAAPAAKAAEPAPAAKPAAKPATGSTAGAASGKSAATSGSLNEPQPLSRADKNGTGANPGQTCDHSYCSTRDGSPSGNGVGDGEAKGKPCAGCVGKADNKNPKGQAPDGPTDHNAGYECDSNKGIGQTNPAHTGCTSTGTSPVTEPMTPKTPRTPKTPKTPGTPESPGQGTATMTIAADCRTVSVTSTKDISFVEVTFTDGTVLKLEGLSGTTFSRTYAKDIRSARAKSATTIVSTVATGCGVLPVTTTCPDGSAMPAGGADDCPKRPLDGVTPDQPGTNPVVKLCPNGQVMPDGDPASCPTAPPVCPTIMPTVGPVMAGCSPTTSNPPPGGALPIDGVTPDQPAVNPVPAGPRAVSPVIVPNTAVLPAVLNVSASGPAAAAAAAGVPSTLPFTGTDLALLVQLGALLLLAGGGFLVVARRERLARATA